MYAPECQKIDFLQELAVSFLRGEQDMFIHLQHTELVAASPERLFAVLTDYESYPRWNRQCGLYDHRSPR